MFEALRRSWKNYLASIPKPDDDEVVPDGKIIREDFRPEPIDPEIRDAFECLATEITAHLSAELGSKAKRQLVAKLRPGTEPTDALAQWFCKASAPQAKTWGFLVVDWKAREEVQWQADRLLMAHHLPQTWKYSVNDDQDWKDWHDRGEAPVDTPLKSLGQFLSGHGYSLIRFNNDDLVFAFAVPRSDLASIRDIFRKTSITLASDG